MNTKGIKAVLSKKHKEWIESISDNKVAELASKNTFISGGAITSLYLGEEINDIDVYFSDVLTAVKVADYYVNKWNDKGGNRSNLKVVVDNSIEKNAYKNHKLGYSEGLADKVYDGTEDFSRGDWKVSVLVPSTGVAKTDVEITDEDGAKGDTSIIGDKKEKSEKETHKPVYFTDNAISLSGGVQLVLRFIGDVEEVHKNFDFVHCKGCYTPSTRELAVTAETLSSILTKELIYTGSKYPLCSLFRLRKFYSRGWVANAGQILKMVFQLSDLNLKDAEVLREQLIGVDTAYMSQMIDAIRKYTKDSKDKPLDTSYLLDLTNKLFEESGEINSKREGVE